ncbi:MAG: hypothetical protein RML56_08585 [Burkholderiales bacterium]|nr:hypothetical protein [Burkholderiales bacterium]
MSAFYAEGRYGMLCHMSYRERHFAADGTILDLRIAPGGAWRLRWGRPGAWRVRYENGRRTVLGRRRRYEFRSVEQLRYDFERDVARAARHG